jgi:hypothetical protein
MAITRHNLTAHPSWTWRKTKEPGVHKNRGNVIYSDKMALNRTHDLINLHRISTFIIIIKEDLKTKLIVALV